jgi:hypothetical protein
VIEHLNDRTGKREKENEIMGETPPELRHEFTNKGPMIAK